MKFVIRQRKNIVLFIIWDKGWKSEVIPIVKKVKTNNKTGSKIYTLSKHRLIDKTQKYL